MPRKEDHFFLIAQIKKWRERERERERERDIERTRDEEKYELRPQEKIEFYMIEVRNSHEIRLMKKMCPVSSI